MVANVKEELNQTLKENKHFKEMFNPNWLVNVLSKGVSNLYIRGNPKANQSMQYQDSSNYIGRLRQPQLACGANGILMPSGTWW